MTSLGITTPDLAVLAASGEAFFASHSVIESSSDCKILKNVVSEVLSGLFSKLEIVACLMPIFSPIRSASSRFAGEPVSLHSPIALGYRSSESSSCHTSTANLSS